MLSFVAFGVFFVAIGATRASPVRAERGADKMIDLLALWRREFRILPGAPVSEDHKPSHAAADA